MQNFNAFLDMFFSSQYFIVVVAVLAIILLMLLIYLIKLQYSYKGPSIKQDEEQIDLVEEVIKSVNENSVLDLDSLNNTQANLILDLKANPEEHIINNEIIAPKINPIEQYELAEEENAIISTKDLEKIEKERDEYYGKENNAKLIEEYEQNQEQKAIISYDELLRNASLLEVNYIEKPREEGAPIIKQVEIKEQPLKGVSYTAEEEYLKILKEFRNNLLSSG